MLLKNVICLFFKIQLDPFIPEFLKWILPSLNLVRTIVPNTGFSQNLNRTTDSVDPDERAHYESSHPDPHCLHRYVYGLQG